MLPGLEEGFLAAGVAQRDLGAALGVVLPARIALNRAGEILAQRDNRLRAAEETIAEQKRQLHEAHERFELEQAEANERLATARAEIEELKESSEAALDRVLTQQRWEDFSVSRKLQQEIGKRRRIEELLGINCHDPEALLQFQFSFLIERVLGEPGS